MKIMNAPSNSIIEKALSGDKTALENIITEAKDLVYNLSLKMLLFPDDAKDATQEILIKIVTHLSTFKGESQFQTWVYRIASNYLLTEKKKLSRAIYTSIEDYASLIDRGQSNAVLHAKNEGELLLLEEEVKVSCTHGLLLCLNKKGRIIYILGEILEINSVEGANILEISAENFRKQLSRSREKIRNFLQSKCGLTNPQNPCRCKKKIDFLIEENMIDPKNLRFAQHTKRSIDLVEKIDSLDRAVSVFRSVPNQQTPETLLHEVKKTINAITT
ncbi:RNA polymerase sigma factor [Fulvivirga sp. M361]|uniref:RNA polymerase sigma factor n=1 Tax=Fulvivirga sp. M361 TaxID=2594266 RepID=UPI00117AB22C|nr:RNA polymerase sigma factor [Fulvivirga sp. M361]TRX62733.1 RNA polymerase sigma factor [Fulvivirga sp. M361]